MISIWGFEVIESHRIEKDLDENNRGKLKSEL